MAPLLEAIQLSRRYGDYQALRPTDLVLHAGDLVALTGRNGSGKSTLLLCLSGLLSPTSGSVCIAGHDLFREEREAHRALAYVPDVPVFYHELTAWDHLHFIALAHNAASGFEQRAEELLVTFGLWEARNLYPHAYSRGMRLKLGLLLALIRPFQVLLLDEPASALDAESTGLLAGTLAKCSQDGKAVLFSTHSGSFVGLQHSQQWRMEDGQLFQSA